MSLTTLQINGVDYQAYATLAQADNRLAVDPVRGPAWSLLDVNARLIRLVAATNRLDLLAWSGAKAGGAAQVNAWPRIGLKYPDGTAVDDASVPIEVEFATILVAGTSADDVEVTQAGSTNSNVRRLQAGSAQIEFFSQVRNGVPLQDATAFDIIRLFVGRSSTGLAASGESTGTKREGVFTDGLYGLTGGL